LALSGKHMSSNRKRKLLKWILITGGLLLVISAVTIWYLFTLKYEDTKKVKADYTVNAMPFLSEFTATDTTANKKYREKIIIVNGRVSETETAIDSSINIKMTDTLNDNYIIFSFQDKDLAEAKSINIGDSVSIKGSFSEGLYSEVFESVMVTFKRCSLNK
jgi:translation initiation factor 2 beta subunit (eIF-2beta)/eIF-5